MEIDATDPSTQATLEAEVAVVGAGPAGITLALELADAGHSVLLIESGGDSYSAAAQHLGDTVGHDSAHVPMSLATRRQIGGASNLWGGRCVPFDPIDFRRRRLTGDARWPVAYDELRRHFPRACEWFMCGEPIFDAAMIPALAGAELVPGWPQGDVRSTTLERWSSSTNFGRAYRARLRDSRRVTVVSRLTCTEVVCDADGRQVEHLAARTLTGRRVRVLAKRYVLACGGIETTRLLFASDRAHPRGLGNHSGHLGRWYMAHLGAAVAEARFTTPPAQTIYGFERDRAGIYVRRRFTFAPDYLDRHDLPNVAMWLDNPEIGDPAHGNEALSLIYLILASPLGRYCVAEGIRQRKTETAGPVSNSAHVRNILRNLPRATRFALGFGWERFVRRENKVPGVFVPSASNAYRLYYHAEHLPHRDSEVTPTRERDALGMPRMRTRLRFKDDDLDAAVRAHRHFDDYLRRHGLGRLRYLYEDLHAGLREQLLDGYHQAGTTRMSERPEDGVLDPQLRVHGVSNLFVASSSAFVTSGQANSTFMIVVFALRLAEHLRRTLRAPGPRVAVHANGALAGAKLDRAGVNGESNHLPPRSVGDIDSPPSRAVGDREPI